MENSISSSQIAGEDEWAAIGLMVGVLGMKKVEKRRLRQVLQRAS